MRKINSFWVPSILAISQILTKCRIESKQRNFKLAKVKMFKRFNEHLPNMVAQLTHKYISQREILRKFAALGGGGQRQPSRYSRMIIQLTVKIVSKRRSSLERQNLVRFFLFCSVAVRHLSAAAFQFQLEMTTVTQQLSKAEHCTHRDRDSPAADCIVTPLSL